MNKNYKKLYIKYKTKYINLKSSDSKSNEMIGGFDIITNQINWINNIIIQIENLILKSGENFTEKLNFVNNKELISLTSMLEKYLIEQDIPIDLKFNAYNIKELNDSIAQLKTLATDSNLSEIYDQRKRIYEMDDSNYNEILDYIISKNKISSVKDIEKLFSSIILGNNKNYIIYYMVLLRYLIVNKIQLSILEEYSPILSLYGLKSCLSTELNSDEYLPLILKLLYEYINSFPIKKVLLIKKPSEFESDRKNRQKLLLLEIDELPNTQMIKFDTKNKIFMYESGEIKESEKINFDDLIKILFNLFRIYVPKIKPEFEQKNKINTEEKSIV